VPRLRTAYRLEGQAAIEGHEPAAVLHGKGQQIDVRDLLWTEDVGVVEQFSVGDRDTVGPKLVIGLRDLVS
jgi:hypothetical protein